MTAKGAVDAGGAVAVAGRHDSRVVGRLEQRLRERRDAGRSLLVPYVTAGVSADWLDHTRAFAAAGADAIEIGIPFSDPMLDGSPVQQAGRRSLDRGTTPRSAITEAAALQLDVPLVAMTYSNVVLRHGAPEFCRRLQDSGFAGLIVVDTPHDESEPLRSAAAEHDLDLVMLLAPSTAEGRVQQIATSSTGFVYAVTVMAPTGERAGLVADAVRMTAQVRRHTSVPVLLGFGITTPAEAARAAAVADGAVVGSVLMSRLLAGAGPDQTGRAVQDLRDALDRREPRPPRLTR